MSEADEMRPQMKAATRFGARLFRNNVGQVWTGSRQIKNKDGSITIHNPRPFHGGLCSGSGDLIGWTPVTISASDVGKTLALFTSVEIKTGRGRPTERQANWAGVVLSVGGLAGISKSADDLHLILSGKGVDTLKNR
ncbi:MAG: VRR-NUC domain-containing protein [Cohaesibacter sp.]|nr:VRR-NUC domain-containing protein [Cohaesibacter sp.]